VFSVKERTFVFWKKKIEIVFCVPENKFRNWWSAWRKW